MTVIVIILAVAVLLIAARMLYLIERWKKFEATAEYYEKMSRDVKRRGR